MKTGALHPTGSALDALIHLPLRSVRGLFPHRDKIYPSYFSHASISIRQSFLMCSEQDLSKAIRLKAESSKIPPVFLLLLNAFN